MEEILNDNTIEQIQNELVRQDDYLNFIVNDSTTINKNNKKTGKKRIVILLIILVFIVLFFVLSFILIKTTTLNF